MTYFTTCRTLDDARNEYRKLVVENHPDRGGNPETFKQIAKEYEQFLAAMINKQFKQDEWDMMSQADREKFGNVLEFALSLNCRVEIIGTWIFCFESESFAEELVFNGFWWSKQHKAFVWSQGTDKKMVPARMNTERLKNRYGSETMRRKRFI